MTDAKYTLARLKLLRTQLDVAIEIVKRGELRELDPLLHGPNRIGDFLITDTKAHEGLKCEK